MAKFIKHSERVEVEVDELVFQWQYDPGSAYCFPCDRDGSPILEGLSDVALENLNKYLDGVYPVLPGELRTRYETYTEPAVIVCAACSAHVELYDSWASECSRCGTEYNGAGQRLAPRSQWGEETGESVFDMEQGVYSDDEVLS